MRLHSRRLSHSSTRTAMRCLISLLPRRRADHGRRRLAGASRHLSIGRRLLYANAPALTDLSGTWLVSSGELRPSQLRGSWLGGPVTLHFSQTHGPRAVLHARAEGSAEGAALAQALAADPAHSLAGRFEWHAEFRDDLEAPAGERWRIEAESSLAGLSSALPAPLAKAAHESLGAHLEFMPVSAGLAQLNVHLADRLAAMFELASGEEAGWTINRGGIRLGGAEAALPAGRVLSAGGRTDQLDLARWFAVWPQLLAARAAPSPRIPEVNIDLSADTLLIGGEAIAEARVIGTLSDSALDLNLASHALSGSVHWPSTTTRAAPAQLHLEHARFEGLDRSSLSALLAGMPAMQAVRLDIDDLSFAGERLGRIGATLTATRAQLLLTELTAQRPAQEMTGSGSCERVTQLCRMRFELTSRDVAATLRDFRLRPELVAQQAKFSGELSLSLADTRPWLAATQGEVRFEVGEGVLAPSEGSSDAPRFAIFSVPALLSAGSISPSFTSLDASFALRDGQASTADLRLSGRDLEVLMSGRVGLLDHDFEQQGRHSAGGR